jgi:outer membrane protein TolC
MHNSCRTGRRTPKTWAGLALASACIAAQAQLPARQPQAATTATAGPARDLAGDAQTAYLSQRVSEFNQPERGVPIERFASRVSAAVLNNPSTLAARSSLGAAGEAVREARAGVLPFITGQLDASSRNNDANLILNTPDQRYSTGGAGLTLRQLLFDFGATQAAIDAAREREGATLARVQNRDGDLALRSIEAWYDVVRARAQSRLAQLNLEAMQSMQSFLEQRMQLGGGPVSDVLRAQTRVTAAFAASTASKAREQVSVAAFRELYREEPGDIDLPVAVALNLQSVEADTASLVREFPAVSSADAARRAAEQDRDQSAARALPQLNMELSAQRRDLIGSGQPGTDLGAFVVMRYNFYTGGADSARTAQAGFRVSEATEQLRSISQQVERALAQALAEQRSAETVLRARADGVTQSIVALGAVRELFVNRRGSLLDLLNAQETVNLSGQAFIDAEIDAALARWRVIYFTPGFWTLLGLPQVPTAYAAPGSGAPGAPR